MNTRFRMYDISLDQFAILSKNIPNNEVSFDMSLGFKFADFGKKVACTTNYKFHSSGVELMVLQVTCGFEIQPDDWEKLHKNNTIVIPKALLEFFAVHTVGTSRGILFCKTEKTPFSIIIIPPINVSGMVKGDYTINLNDNKEDE